jgi:hypothetical protein
MIDLGRTTGGNEIFDNTLLYGPHVGILRERLCHRGQFESQPDLPQQHSNPNRGH